ncbi:hypothetical protein SDC9_207354 [bioreactor metagenome]|uniref:Uncharacterized protein n=1 Tax=bioreactor metagenome TaxID=1076179 RepID=A0A645JJ22_9ZZZZ
MSGGILWGVNGHGPEFINIKVLLMDAYAFLFKKDWTFGIGFDGDHEDTIHG